jgi:hypothetical protein
VKSNGRNDWNHEQLRDDQRPERLCLPKRIEQNGNHDIRLTRTITQMAPDGSSVITDSNARMCSFNGWTPQDNRGRATNGKPRAELRENQGSFAS